MNATDQQALETYFLAIESREKALMCAYIPNFTVDFERKYDAWMRANAVALTHGERVADERGMTGRRPPSIQSFAKAEANLLRDLPADDRERRCGELLSAFSSKGTS